ncbi:DEK1, partial [Symbiodinium sp. KB8]
MFTKRVDEPREVEGYVGVVQTTLTYEVEVRAFRECEFTLRWEGSANMAPEDGSEATEAKVVIQPYERRRLVVLQQQDLLAGWSLSIGSSWLERQPSVERCNAAVAETAEAIDAELRTAKTLDFGADAATIDHLNAVCEEHGVKFVDLEFPPVEASLFSAASKHAPKPGARKITWRRATDFLDPDKLDVFVQGVEPSDISQGALGDCWLLCSIAACTEFPWLITRMFQVHGDDAEPQSANPYGVYKVRLCKNGQWQYVRLDDYFPCYPGSGPVYAKTHEQQELWVPLVEKAMAKLCGTYDALRAGLP